MTIEGGSASSLASLSPRKQLAFALLLFERMLPSLITFSEDTGFDASCYLSAREASWAALQNGIVSQALTEACTQGAPDTEIFSHELTSYALNAALAMSDIAEFTRDGNADHITYVLSLARDSVHLYLGSLVSSLVSSSEEDDSITEHPIMQRELSRENEDVEFLASLPEEFDNRSIAVLRDRAGAQPKLLPARK